MTTCTCHPGTTCTSAASCAKARKLHFGEAAHEAMKPEDFKHWLNDRRGLDVSQVFHEVIGKYDAMWAERLQQTAGQAAHKCVFHAVPERPGDTMGPQDAECVTCGQRPTQPAGQAGGALPPGWVPLTIEHEPGYPEEVAFGPQRMMDRLKKWLDSHFANLAAKQQAGGEVVGHVLYDNKFGCKAGQLTVDLPIGTPLCVATPAPKPKAEPVQLDVVRQAIEDRDAMEAQYHALASSMVYEGNSVSWWHSKAKAYRNVVDAVWAALRAAGISPDGTKTCADGVRELADTQAEPVRVPVDVRAHEAKGWRDAATWLRNNYQEHPNIASLCEAMVEAGAKA